MCQYQYYGSFVSLKGAPEYVGFRFDFNENENLKDFTDFPTYVGATIDARSTGLYSFDCIPESATKVYIDNNTPLFAVLRCVSSNIFPILQRNRTNTEIFIDFEGKSSEAVETFKAYDPIHPPKNEGDKPILYMDRFRMLLVEIEKKSVSNLLYSKASDTYKRLDFYYDIRNNEYKIEEGIFNYFSKESKDKRRKIKEIKDGLIKLIDNHLLQIENKIRWVGNTPMKQGNTIINTRYGRIWININDDFTVDIYGDVYICNFRGNDLNELPCKFNKIDGNFFIELSYSINDFIDKFPERVEGKLRIENCGLNSLENLPTKYVGNKFICSSNNLETLEGLPEYIGGTPCSHIDASSNDIYTLEGLENYKGDVGLYLNPIEYIKFYDKQSDHFIKLENLIIDTIISRDSPDVLKDTYANLDIFRACDPIHPPLSKGGKPILYLSRMEAFANQLNLELNLRNHERYYDVR